ncbi:MAG: DUF420 domain-containing protein [Candidatus Methanoperedens sp.]|nr:DUF420 domain-containing protein [Candidatus Methanoperedens sp.]MCZ7406162.1 DUF420 domain-containing protein [Candidatus Methanoperedens sp.]
MAATLTQTINLGIHIGILLFVIVGYLFVRKQKIIWHAELITISFAMILISFLLVMIPSLLMNYNTFLDPATVVFDIVSIVHIPLGIAVTVLGAILVIRWARNDYSLDNMKATLLMRFTLVSWAASVLTGAAIYFTMPS